jgi:hypothetical protein
MSNQVYFAPLDEAKVGVLDTDTDTFSVIVATGVTAAGTRFVGAVAVNNKVYFVPYSEAKVGVLDTSTNTFNVITTTDVDGDASTTGDSVTTSIVSVLNRNERTKTVTVFGPVITASDGKSTSVTSSKTVVYDDYSMDPKSLDPNFIPPPPINGPPATSTTTTVTSTEYGSTITTVTDPVVSDYPDGDRNLPPFSTTTTSFVTDDADGDPSTTEDSTTTTIQIVKLAADGSTVTTVRSPVIIVDINNDFQSNMTKSTTVTTDVDGDVSTLGDATTTTSIFEFNPSAGIKTTTVTEPVITALDGKTTSATTTRTVISGFDLTMPHHVDEFRRGTESTL